MNNFTTMKAKLIQVPEDNHYSFRVTNDIVQYFYNPFHYHESIEIVYTLKGSGTRFIGDHMEPFHEDDLVLVGENLPHCWKSDPSFFEQNSKAKAEAIVVQFQYKIFESLFKLNEFKDINKLLADAQKGIRYDGNIKSKIKQKLIKISKAKDSRRFSILIDILNLLASTNEKVYLNPSRINNINHENLNRLNTVYEYSIENIHKKISLDEISAVACLSPNAFCRYFKQHTRKSYTEFLNDLRISKISQVLVESNNNIADIAFENGFNNLAHFIKTFKKIKGTTPQEYRKSFRASTL